MRRLALAAWLALAPPAQAAEGGFGHLDFARLSKTQEAFFWRRLKSLAVEEAVLSYCGAPDDFAARAKAGVRACVTEAALAKAEGAFNAEMKTATAALRARKAECKGKPKPTSGWLGVEIARAEKGVAVLGTVEGSPAASADIKAGDVIESVNGEEVSEPKDLSARIRALAPGATIKLKLRRDGAMRAASVTLGAMAFDASGAAALDMPALISSSRQDLSAIADEVTNMCAKCSSTIWAVFCR